MSKRSVQRVHGLPALPRRAGILGAAIVLSGTVVLAADEVLKKADQAKLGKDIAAYFEAKDQAKGIEQAFVDLIDSIDKTEKKLKGTDPLSLVEDWEQAFFNARLESLDETLRLKKGRVDSAEVTAANGAKVSFGASLPKTYREKDGPYPLVLIVPSPGTALDAILESEWEDVGLRDAALLFAVGMPAQPENWSVLNGSDGQMGGIAVVMSLYGEVLKQYSVDMNRVYLAGSGEGVAAAVAVASAFPHIFAGVIGRGAAPALPEPKNFRTLPTLFVGTSEGASAFKTAAGDLGFDNVTLMDAGGSAEVFAWMGEHRRDPYPTALSFSPATPYTTKAHWIGLEGIDIAANPHVEASINREENTITIDAQRVGSVLVFFNDVLVDMDKPVTLVINGESNPVQVGRNRRTMLDLVYNFGDWGRIFTNVMTFDITAKD